MLGSVDNILSYYYAASPETVQQGYDWYADANALAYTLGEFAGISVQQACDIIAADSINTSWDRNVTLAWDHAVNGGRMGTLGSTIRLVERIIAGERLADIVKPSARKVRSFSANIMGDLSVATVDRWAYRIWVNLADCKCVKRRKDGTLKHGCGHVPNGAEYARVAADYAAAAAAVRVPVAVLQAIVWIVLRGGAA